MHFASSRNVRLRYYQAINHHLCPTWPMLRCFTLPYVCGEHLAVVQQVSESSDSVHLLRARSRSQSGRLNNQTVLFSQAVVGIRAQDQTTVCLCTMILLREGNWERNCDSRNSLGNLLRGEVRLYRSLYRSYVQKFYRCTSKVCFRVKLQVSPRTARVPAYLASLVCPWSLSVIVAT